MLADKYLRDELNKFAKYVIQQSRSNLSKGKKNVSKELYNSLGYEISESDSTMSLSFDMVDYGMFQDRGVSGTEKKYNTPYKYTNKMPPAKAFDKWTVRKGIAPRGKGGKFEKRSMFFTKPFAAAFKRLPDELVEAYSIGIEKQIQVNISK